jgi:hypothetical protein
MARLADLTGGPHQGGLRDDRTQRVSVAADLANSRCSRDLLLDRAGRLRKGSRYIIPFVIDTRRMDRS